MGLKGVQSYYYWRTCPHLPCFSSTVHCCSTPIHHREHTVMLVMAQFI